MEASTNLAAQCKFKKYLLLAGLEGSHHNMQLSEENFVWGQTAVYLSWNGGCGVNQGVMCNIATGCLILYPNESCRDNASLLTCKGTIQRPSIMVGMFSENNA